MTSDLTLMCIGARYLSGVVDEDDDEDCFLSNTLSPPFLHSIPPNLCLALTSAQLRVEILSSPLFRAAITSISGIPADCSRSRRRGGSETMTLRFVRTFNLVVKG